MSSAISSYLDTCRRDGIIDHQVLDLALAELFEGLADPEDVQRFLEHSVALMRDPRAIAAGASALRARMRPVTAPIGAIDVCGTGGDGAHTLNISTAVAFVVAGAGVPVAKHGNRAMSSRSGAADVLEKLGVHLTDDRGALEACMAQAKIAFLFAQAHHPAMRHVAAARRAFGRRTLFNLLGPLANPATVAAQLIGVYAPEAAKPMADAATLLQLERVLVVHGAGGLDELSLIAPGHNVAVAVGLAPSLERALGGSVGDLAAQFGCTPFSADALRGGSPEDNAEALKALLRNQLALDHPYRTVVLLNAAAGLVLAQPQTTADLTQGWNLAEHSLRSGAAAQALSALVDLTNTG
jgi:anthranilate phosphoribosyltransferase